MTIQARDVSVISTPSSSPAAPLRHGLLARHPLVAYFVWAYAGAWLVVLPLILSRSGSGVLPVTLPALPFLVLGPLAGPTLAAFVITSATEGKAGRRALLRRCGLWRVGARWYLLLVVGPLAALLLGAYAAAGFLAVPHFARQALSAFVRTHYARTLTLRDIRFNPFTLNLDVTGVALPDADGQPMLAFDRLHVGLQLASLWRLGPSFGEILLERPYVRAVLRPDGELAFERWR